ncbi:molybdopterin molybdotransferase MoeA [Catenuloplanes atrovinosus]|uniref:Molybdopterin molybdenumtransferase n=1 Tax=Catenuloplanes atrovinosus TaxID=137266 RepID=A0AAE3YRR4_9ACTN|nr:molybdopterin molybdotransferase MoeA [Catenuloplanes atrovinosus]MDR7278435.1 molybdopterin molybdotransferase [Catenuloplanes atrovinosus]
MPTSPGTDAHPHTTAPGVPADLPWHRAHRLAATLPVPLPAERVPLDRAHGRTLAEPAVSAALLPGTDTAAMDGYAIAGPAPWRITGRVLAGHPATDVTAMAPGTAVEIATGAPVPPGAGAVLPIELCLVEGDTVRPSETGPGRTHIRYTGEDLTPGRLLAPAGARVTATLTGLAAHAGLDELTVRRSPRVRLIATGDEVIGSGVPAPGQVRDALTPLLTALLAGTGATLAGAAHVPDRAELLAESLTGTDWDVAVVTGSSSVGRADHLHGVLTRAGARWHVDGVACRPGHPQALARLGTGQWVVGLPGNPYAALVGAVTLLRPLLDALQGRTRPAPLRLPVAGKVHPYDGGTRLVPVHLTGGHATAIQGARPASLLSAGTADALAVIPADWTPGAPADLLPVQ